MVTTNANNNYYNAGGNSQNQNQIKNNNKISWNELDKISYN
jgi:hypothetical protein